MDRKTFNTSLIGGALATALPLPSRAAAVKPLKSPLYAWAVAIARAQNRASPALLAQQLGISKVAASELYASMISNGVIRAPLFGGVAKAVQPLFKGGQIVGVETSLSRKGRLKLKDVKRIFDDIAAKDVDLIEPSEGQTT